MIHIRQSIETRTKNVAQKTAELDSRQQVLDNNRNRMPPRLAQDVQDDIDRERFDVELDRLALQVRSSPQ